MAISLLSAALGKGISSSLAMTGELTLTGKVLPVGGIREKVAAAKRSGVNTVILPRANEADWQKLPAYIKDGMTVHLVDSFDEIAKICQFI
jgi:ATP-dependent Lon protease